MTKQPWRDQERKTDPFRSPTGKKISLSVDIVALYKKLIASDEPEFQKLIREMTKCFVTASTIGRKLNRVK